MLYCGLLHEWTANQRQVEIQPTSAITAKLPSHWHIIVAKIPSLRACAIRPVQYCLALHSTVIGEEFTE